MRAPLIRSGFRLAQPHLASAFATLAEGLAALAMLAVILGWAIAIGGRP